MYLAINNQNSGCFTVDCLNEKAQEFMFIVLNGIRQMDDYSILNQGWQSLKSQGCYQPQWSGQWAWTTEEKGLKHIELSL